MAVSWLTLTGPRSISYNVKFNTGEKSDHVRNQTFRIVLTGYTGTGSEMKAVMQSNKIYAIKYNF